jgi:hypothetical protein
MGNNAQGYQLLGLGSSSSKMPLLEFSNPGIVSDRKCCSLAKRPFQVGISLLGASTSFANPTRLGDTRNYTSIRTKLLCTLKTVDVPRLIQNGQRQNLANAGDCLQQFKVPIIIHRAENYAQCSRCWSNCSSVKLLIAACE